jgi:hypothetical protein
MKRRQFIAELGSAAALAGGGARSGQTECGGLLAYAVATRADLVARAR